jgi:HlyD family secretion protein
LFIQTFLIKTSNALNVANGLSDTNLSTYKGSISTARENINTSIQSISALIDKISSQKILVQKKEKELDLEKIGATTEVLAQALASINRAEATIKSAESALSKTIMRSPINGIVTKQDGKVGEIIQSGLKIISVMGQNNFEVETNISEADLSKIKLGDKSEITLDAFGNEKIFNAEITEIDPAEKIVDGVSTYKTTLRFLNPINEIRSGMTANVKITTAKKEDVLVVPQKTVYTKESGKFVTVIKKDNSTEQREISVGLKGSNGNFEVLNGLEIGEKISLTQIK